MRLCGVWVVLGVVARVLAGVGVWLPATPDGPLLTLLTVGAWACVAWLSLLALVVTLRVRVALPGRAVFESLVGAAAVVALATPVAAADGGPFDRLSAPARPAARSVVVARGDTLWGIASASLGSSPPGAAVAAEWPRWYAANRSVVGPDPGLLLPGQRLVAPEGTS